MEEEVRHRPHHLQDGRLRVDLRMLFRLYSNSPRRVRLHVRLHHHGHDSELRRHLQMQANLRVMHQREEIEERARVRVYLLHHPDHQKNHSTTTHLHLPLNEQYHQRSTGRESPRDHHLLHQEPTQQLYLRHHHRET